MTVTMTRQAITPADAGWVDELQARESVVIDTPTDDDAEAREVGGVGVPFGETISLWWGSERFDPECEFDDLDRALLFYGHREPIGRIVSHERTADGLRVRFKISATDRGDEVYTLLRDGVLDRFSIGFQPREYLTDDEGLVTHTRVRVREFSVVPFPAYDDAVIDEVRHRPTDPQTPTNHREDTMTDTLTPDTLETRLAEHQRNLEGAMARALEAHSPASVVAGDQWRSAGEFLAAIAREDSAALEFHRAYAGGVFADSATPSTWIADAIQLVDERRRVLNSFSRDTLPAEGNVLEYAALASNTIAVAEQTAEGEPLTFGKITLTSATSAVKTYGGYTSIGLQTILRSSTPYLNTTLRAMDIAYARATELAVRTTLQSLVAARKTANDDLDLADLSAATVFDWLDLIVDAAERADDRGFVVAGLKVSKDVFKALYRLSANGEPLLEVKSGQGTNKVGTLRASELAADLADVRVELVPSAPALFATFYDPVAITTWEQPGAPVQLQDDGVINLARDFSKYGFVSIGSQFPTALTPVTIAAA